jgi:hypothetical protein
VAAFQADGVRLTGINLVDVQSERQRIRLRQLARPSQRASTLRQRLIRLPEQQKCPSDEAFAGNARIVGSQLRRSVLSLIIEDERLPEMVKRTVDFGAKQKADAQAPVRYQLMSL